MPLVQIHLERELFDRDHEALSREIHEAQMESLDVPADDLFQVFIPHDAGELKFDPTYGGVDRRHLMVIHITMVHRYPVAKKRELYRAIVERYGRLGVRPEDIQIAISENGYEDWYAGKLA